MNFFKTILFGMLVLVPGISFAQSVTPSSSTDVDPVWVNRCKIDVYLGYKSRDIETKGRVSLLQNFLIDQGYLSGRTTGFYGDATRTAVGNFQLDTKLTTSATVQGFGNVGPLTRAKINSIICGTGTVTPPTATTTPPATTGSLGVLMSAAPVARNLLAGTTAAEFANIIFDATGSTEGVRFSSVSLEKNFSAGVYTHLSGCQLFDDSKALNTAGNTFNPTKAQGEMLYFDNALIVAKGTIKTLKLKCNVNSSATGSFSFTINPTNNPKAVGVLSNNAINPTGIISSSAPQTISTTSLSVNPAPAGPGSIIAVSGSTGVSAGMIRLRATTSGVDISRITLKLVAGDVASVARVSVWDGDTWLGANTFTPENMQATVAFAKPFRVPKDIDKDLTIKINLNEVGVGAGVQGDRINIGVVSADGTIVANGGGITAASTYVGPDIRVFKSFPTFTLDTLPSSGVADGNLLKFKVSARKKGDVSIGQLRFKISPSGISSVSNVNLFAFTDAGYSLIVPAFSSGVSKISITPDANGLVTIAPSVPIVIPAGQTYYFKLIGTISGVQGTSSVSTSLLGDSSYASAGALAGVAASNNFVWSPDASSLWVNGFVIPGLPSSGINQFRVASISSGASQMASVMSALGVTAVAVPEVNEIALSQAVYSWEKNLQLGSTYTRDVIALQRVLQQEGFFEEEATGGFYNRTYLAVKAFQKKYGIDPTGFVGQATREKLNSLYGSN